MVTYSQTESMERLISVFERDVLELNPYAYFELAYTRTTGWMAWICDKRPNADTGRPEADRKVIARGQGDSAEAACAMALEAMQ